MILSSIITSIIALRILMIKSPITDLEINSSIVEYDIRSANTSLMRYYNMIPEKQIASLEKLTKKKREIAVGLLCQKDKEFSKKLNNAFDDIVNMFIEVNGLDEMEILSIKKDAVFVMNRKDIKTEFGPVIFIPKNRYHSFIKINNFEFYINDEKIDVKGLQNQQDKHVDGILFLIRDILNTCIKSNMNHKDIQNYLSEFVLEYKKKTLDFPIYREFNQTSQYAVWLDGEKYYFDEIDETYIDELDISFNYINIILPLVRLLLK